LDGVPAMSQGRYLHRATQTQKQHIHTYMLRIGFEPTIPVFELPKIFRALDIDCVILHTFRYGIDVFVLCIVIDFLIYYL
jgi:hypothetical protein